MIQNPIAIDFHLFDFIMTSYAHRGNLPSNVLLRDVFDNLIEDKNLGKYHIIDKKEGESTSEKRDILIFSLVYTKGGSRIKGKMAVLRDKLPVFLSQQVDIDEIFFDPQNRKLAEITHFCVDLRRIKPFVMFEFNSNGPRINDFEYYIRQIAKKKNIAKFCNASLRVKGDIDVILKDIVNVGEIEVKVKQENTAIFKSVDDNFYSSIKALNHSYPFQTIRLSAGYSRKSINYGGLDLARKLLSFFSANVKKIDQVEDLKMTVDRGSGFELYDLIKEKETISLSVNTSSPGRPDSKHLFDGALHQMNIYLNQN